MYITNQGNPFSFLAPPHSHKHTHSSFTHRLSFRSLDYQFGWLRSSNQKANCSISGHGFVLQTEFTHTDSFFRSSGLPWRSALRVALGITALNSSHLWVHWVGANKDCTYSHTPLISTTVRLRIKCPGSWGTVTKKKLQIKWDHHLWDCRMEKERESEQAKFIYGMSGGHWGSAGPRSGDFPRCLFSPSDLGWTSAQYIMPGDCAGLSWLAFWTVTGM